MDDDPSGQDPEQTAEHLREELARVRAERDELRDELTRVEVAVPADQVSRHRVRRVVAVVLVIASCLSFLTGGIGIWASRNFLDTDVWVERTGPLIDDPDVQAVVSTQLTDAVMELVDPQALFEEVLPERGQLLAGPLSGAVRGFVGDQVAAVVDSDAFGSLWLEVNRRAHAAAVNVLEGNSDVVTAGDQTVTLNLLPIINRVLERIGEVSPELFGRTVDIPTIQVDEIPQSAIDTINARFGTDLPPDFGQITIYDQGKLKELQDAVQLFNRIVWLSVAVFVISTVGALAISVDRRRTLLQLACADVVLLALMRRGAIRAQDQVLELVQVETNEPAVDAVTTAMFSGLFDGTRLLLWLVAIIIVVALVSGPGRRAVEVRRRVGAAAVSLASAARDRSADPATTAWLLSHRDLLQVSVGALAVVALWWLDLSWLGVLVVLALAAAGIVLLARLPEPPDTEATRTGSV